MEPGTSEDIEVLQLLKIPKFGGGKGEEGEEDDDQVESNINDVLGALADKEKMDDLVKELMGRNS